MDLKAISIDPNAGSRSTDQFIVLCPRQGDVGQEVDHLAVSWRRIDGDQCRRTVENLAIDKMATHPDAMRASGHAAHRGFVHPVLRLVTGNGGGNGVID